MENKTEGGHAVTNRIELCPICQSPNVDKQGNHRTCRWCGHEWTAKHTPLIFIAPYPYGTAVYVSNNHSEPDEYIVCGYEFSPIGNYVLLETEGIPIRARLDRVYANKKDAKAAW